MANNKIDRPMSQQCLTQVQALVKMVLINSLSRTKDFNRTVIINTLASFKQVSQLEFLLIHTENKTLANVQKVLLSGSKLYKSLITFFSYLYAYIPVLSTVQDSVLICYIYLL